MRGGVIRLNEAEARIPGPAGERAAKIFRRGSLDIALSLPTGPNVQTPHAQDEIYMVLRGSGRLIWEEHSESFDTGDILFVAAGVEHHYVIWRCGAYFTAPKGANPKERSNAQQTW